ncbi:MAG: hypothetical protein MJ176_06735 [Treponema sp.]|nr:hypothetical protein [Treponema sp.]
MEILGELDFGEDFSVELETGQLENKLTPAEIEESKKENENFFQRVISDFMAMQTNSRINASKLYITR